MKDIKDNFEVKLERFLRGMIQSNSIFLEARFLAKLSHTKIIRYYNSWVEVTEKEKLMKEQK